MKRDYRADVLRISACVAVVMIHANSFYNAAPGTGEYVAKTVYALLSSFAVPVFAMLTGMLLLDPRKEESIAVIVRRRVLPLLGAWVFWAVVYMVYDSVRLQQPITLKSAFFSLYSGYFHMWYLYMIMLVYLTLPILRLIMSRREVARWYLMLWFAVQIILNTVRAIPYTTKLAVIWQERAYPELVMGFSGYVVLGRYLWEVRMTRKQEYLLTALGAAGLVLGVGISLFITWHLKDGFLLAERFELPAFLFSTGLFCLVMRLLPKGEKEHPALQRIANRSMDVWLVHMIWLNVLFSLPFFRERSLLPGVPLLTAACYLWSRASMSIGRAALDMIRRGLKRASSH